MVQAGDEAEYASCAFMFICMCMWVYLCVPAFSAVGNSNQSRGRSSSEKDQRRRSGQVAWGTEKEILAGRQTQSSTKNRRREGKMGEKAGRHTDRCYRHTRRRTASQTDTLAEEVTWYAGDSVSRKTGSA